MHNVEEFVLICHRGILAVGKQFNLLVSSKHIFRNCHGETQVLDAFALVVLYFHQVLIQLTVKSLEVVDLILLVHHAVQEEPREIALQQAPFEDGFANDHAEEFVLAAHELGTLNMRGREVRVKLVRVTFNEEPKLRVEDALRQFGKELLQQAAAVDSVFHLQVAVHESYAEIAAHVHFVADYLLNRVLHDVVASDCHLCAAMIHVEPFLLLQAINDTREYLCPYFEGVALRTVLKDSGRNLLGDLGEALVRHAILKVRIDDPEPRRKQFKPHVPIHQSLKHALQVFNKEPTKQTHGRITLENPVRDLVKHFAGESELVGPQKTAPKVGLLAQELFIVNDYDSLVEDAAEKADFVLVVLLTQLLLCVLRLDEVKKA